MVRMFFKQKHTQEMHMYKSVCCTFFSRLLTVLMLLILTSLSTQALANDTPSPDTPVISLTVKPGATISFKTSGFPNQKILDLWVETAPGIFEKYSLDNYNPENLLNVAANGTTINIFCDIYDFDCSENKENITALDVSKNPALEQLNCIDNNLTSLDVSNNPALKVLNCASNNLTSLDLRKNTSLKALNSANNKLTSLDLSNNTELVQIWCNNNHLTTLDVSKSTELNSLDCDNNKLTSLDISKNSVLRSLKCSGNQLTSLDVSNNPALKELNCSKNKMTEADIKR